MLRRWGREKIVEIFGADLRSLAAFRIVLAVLVLLNLADRATDLSAHYSDEGVLPRPALLTEVLDPWQFSLNVMNGKPLFQALVFGVAALAALALLLGYRTPLATVIVWVAVVSIALRNPLVSGSEAVLLSLLLFWAMFLPLGAHWSVDRALKAAPPRGVSMRFLSMATAGLFLQIAFMYWFTAVLKSGPEWRVDGTALYYALSYDQYAKPFGAYLLQFPELLEVLTFATLVLEAFGPFLLFFPFFTGPVRTGVVLAFMSFHSGIWLTMSIGMYPWIGALCMVCFLPGWFWDSALPNLRGAFPGQPTITRRYLRRARALLQAYLLLPLRTPISLPGAVGRRSPSVEYGDDYDQPGSPTTSTPPAPPTAEQGESRSAMAPERGTRHGVAGGSEPAVMLRSSLATNLLATFFLLYTFCWNLASVSEFTMPERLAPLGYLLGLGQEWNMFAPAPTKSDYWHVIPGTLRGGQQVDLMAITRDDYHPREGVSWEKPQYVRGIYKNGQWQGYLENIVSYEEYANLRRDFNRYVCQEWNARHTGDEQLTSFQMTYMLEETQPDYQPPTSQKVVLWEHNCFES